MNQGPQPIVYEWPAFWLFQPLAFMFTSQIPRAHGAEKATHAMSCPNSWPFKSVSSQWWFCAVNLWGDLFYRINQNHHPGLLQALALRHHLLFLTFPLLSTQIFTNHSIINFSLSFKKLAHISAKGNIVIENTWPEAHVSCTKGKNGGIIWLVMAGRRMASGILKLKGLLKSTKRRRRSTHISCPVLCAG